MVYSIFSNFLLIMGVLFVSNLISEGFFDIRFVVVSAALSLVGAVFSWFIFSRTYAKTNSD
jgi:hypothetical protein